MAVAFQVTFLTGSISAKRNDDDRAVEWPPHPARLFAAFASAFFEGDEDSAERRALLWLETQDPPVIWAKSTVGEPRVLEVFVPVNDRKVLDNITDPLGQGRLKKPRFFTSASLSDPNVVYHWPGIPDTEILQALDGMGSRVAYLGHSAHGCPRHRADVEAGAARDDGVPGNLPRDARRVPPRSR